MASTPYHPAKSSGLEKTEVKAPLQDIDPNSQWRRLTSKAKTVVTATVTTTQHLHVAGTVLVGLEDAIFCNTPCQEAEFRAVNYMPKVTQLVWQPWRCLSHLLSGKNLLFSYGRSGASSLSATLS